MLGRLTAGENGHYVSIDESCLARRTLESVLTWFTRTGTHYRLLSLHLTWRLNVGGGWNDFGCVVSGLKGHYTSRNHQKSSNPKNNRPGERSVGKVEAIVFELR